MASSKEIHFPRVINLTLSTTPSSILIHEQYIIVGTRDGRLIAFNSKQKSQSVKISTSRISCLAVMPNDDCVVGIDVKGGLVLVDTKTFSIIRKVSIPSGVKKLLVGVATTSILYVATSKCVYSIRLDLKAESVLLYSSPSSPIVSISLSSRGRSVLVSTAMGGEPIRLDDKFNTDTHQRGSSAYVDEGTKWLQRSRSQRRHSRPRRVVPSSSSTTLLSSPAKRASTTSRRNRIDSSSLLTPFMNDDMMTTATSQYYTRKSTAEEERSDDSDSVSSKSSSNSSVAPRASLLVAATTFDTFYVQATIHDTGHVRLVLSSSSSNNVIEDDDEDDDNVERTYTLNATPTDADRLLMEIRHRKNNRRRKSQKLVLAPWLPKLCTSQNFLSACTSSGSVYFIASNYRSYRFEYGQSVHDFSFSGSKFFDDHSCVLALLPRDGRRIEVFRVGHDCVGHLVSET
ncbi:hypothetical protein OAV88_00325 [bacterium]|nr:hypothetical protein [bacterium]